MEKYIEDIIKKLDMMPFNEVKMKIENGEIDIGEPYSKKYGYIYLWILLKESRLRQEYEAKYLSISRITLYAIIATMLLLIISTIIIIIFISLK